MTELTYAALRQIMYQPSAVWLATEYSGDRWLHDQWVMLNVTGHFALRNVEACDLNMPHDVRDYPELGCPPNCPGAPDEIPDGAYKLMADSDKGLQPRESIPPADLEAWFRKTEGAWVPASPSDWSVAEHPGKAMLWVADGRPCLVGETTWTAIKRHYPEASVEYLASRNLFRFCERARLPLSNETPFCFAAGIQVPTGQEEIAASIAKALTQLATTSNLEGESQLATEE